MKLIFSLIVFSTLMINAQSIDSLKKEIQVKLNEVNGAFAVAFVDLQNPDNKIFINENEIFHAASTMKTAVMIEVFKQSNEGKFKLDDSITVFNEFTSIVDGSKYSLSIDNDSGKDLFNFIGQKKTIYQLVFDMITISSNLATNILIEIVKADSIKKTLSELKIEGVNVLRGVEDILAFRQGLNNTVTAKGLSDLFFKLAKGQIISEEQSNAMLEILFHQKHKDVIPAMLPIGLKIAHKTGMIEGIIHDSGIIYLNDGRKYVLVFLSKKLNDVEKGRICGAEISKMIYDFMISR